MTTRNVLEKEVAMDGFSQIREALMYEVFLASGADGFIKKFNFERQARALVKHDWLYE